MTDARPNRGTEETLLWPPPSSYKYLGFFNLIAMRPIYYLASLVKTNRARMQ